MMWLKAHRFHPQALELADRHYSRGKPGSSQFVAPGSCIVLVSSCRRALWVSLWQRPEFVKHAWPGTWENKLFRNEGAGVASELIRTAVAITRAIWTVPAGGIISMVDPKRVRPIARRGQKIFGYCYLKAGFQHVGFTAGGLWVWQMAPDRMPEPDNRLLMRAA